MHSFRTLPPRYRQPERHAPMRSATLLTAGSWALALLVGTFCWLSPDAPVYPSPTRAMVMVGAAFLLWMVGAARTAMPPSAPRLAFRTQVGALAPLFAATAALFLAGRGLLPHPALPTFFIIIVGGALWWWSHRAAGTPSTRGEEAALAVLLVPVGLILFPAIVVAIWGQTLWLAGTPNYARLIDRYNSVARLSVYRPAPDRRISPDAAGLAMVAIGNTGTTHREPLFIEPPGSASRPWLSDSGPFGHMPGDSVMLHAVRGLTRAEREWLATATVHPALGLVDSIAYAAKLDPWAALKLPLPDDATPFTLPIPSMLGIRNAGRLRLYRAALAMSDHQPVVADSLVRSVVGLGLRLHDDSDQLIGALIGTAIAREAGATLAELRAATGKRAEADSIRDALRLASGVPLVRGLDSVADDPAGIRAVVLDAMMADAAPRPVQWDLAAILGIAACTDLRELLYGPTRQIAAAYDHVGDRVEATAHAQAAFAVVRRGIRGAAPSGEVPLIFRPATWALGRAHAGVCVSGATGA